MRVQKALAGDGAPGESPEKLPETTGLSIVQLDGRGRIVAVNDRARDLLRTEDGLFDKDCTTGTVTCTPRCRRRTALSWGF